MTSPATARNHTALPKARILIEALPWLTRFHGKTVVVKFGGNAMVSPQLQRAFAEDMVYLRYAGRAFAAGESSPLPELPVQYADYACHQRKWLTSELMETELEYWRFQLQGGLPPL